MDSKAIGLFLQKLRKEHRLTQKDVAKLCHVSNQAVSKWEKGDSIPDIATLETLSILYKVTINEIVNGEKHVVYMDLNKRKAIVSLFLSLLAFLSFFFVYAVIDIHLDDWFGGGFLDGEIQAVPMRGYDLIFTGTSGVAVMLIWIQFLLYLANTVLIAFTLSGVIRRTRNLNRFITTIHLTLIGITIFALISDLFTPFTQAIMLFVSTLSLVLLPETFDEKGIATSIKKAQEAIKACRENPQSFATDKAQRKTFVYIGFFTSVVLALLITFAFTAVSLFAFFDLNEAGSFVAFIYCGVLLYVFLAHLRYIKTSLAPSLRYLFAFVPLILGITFTIAIPAIYTMDQTVSFIPVVPLIMFISVFLVFFFASKHGNNLNNAPLD